ncbi:MAG: hypothetical protein ACMX3H_07770, partial [Sodalis sp. (in: enterobacteria)]
MAVKKCPYPIVYAFLLVPVTSVQRFRFCPIAHLLFRHTLETFSFRGYGMARKKKNARTEMCIYINVLRMKF